MIPDTGTLGTCRHCGQAVVYGSHDEIVTWSEIPVTRINWYHIRPVEVGRPRVCPIPDSDKFMNAQPKEFCQAKLEDDYEDCNRRVSENYSEYMMCGIHGRKAAERAQWNEERQLQWQMREYLMEETKRVVEELNEFWGIEAHPEKNYGDMTGFVSVNPGTLIQKLREMSMEEF